MSVAAFAITMKRSRRESVWDVSSRLWRWTALLLLFSLTAHIFDSCTSHLGIPDKIAGDVWALHSGVVCQNSANTACAVCSQQPNDRPDICQVTSEVATTKSAASHLQSPPVVLSSPVALPSIPLDLNPPSGVLRSRDGPDVPSLSSLLCRSTLLGRSPPFSA